jgi:hypothetical protein
MQTSVRTASTGLANFDDRIDHFGKLDFAESLGKSINPLKLGREFTAVIDQVADRGILGPSPPRRSLDTFEKAPNRGLTKLTMPGGLKRAADPLLDVINSLAAFADDPGRFKEDPLGLERDPPTLLEEVRDQKTNGPELKAVAIVNKFAGKLPQLIGERLCRQAGKVDVAVEGLAFVRRKEWREGAAPSWSI